MAKLWPKSGTHAHIWAYVFWPWFSHFWASQAENFYENSGDYYLSISVEKSKLWCLLFIFDFLGQFWRENERGHHVRLQTQPKSWPTGWIFLANCYLKIIFLKFSGLNPLLNTFEYEGQGLPQVSPRYPQSTLDTSLLRPISKSKCIFLSHFERLIFFTTLILLVVPEKILSWIE